MTYISGLLEKKLTKDTLYPKQDITLESFFAAYDLSV